MRSQNLERRQSEVGLRESGGGGKQEVRKEAISSVVRLPTEARQERASLGLPIRRSHVAKGEFS